MTHPKSPAPFNEPFAELNESWFKYLLATLVLVFFVIPFFSELFVSPSTLLGKLLYIVVFLTIVTGAIGISRPGGPVFFGSLLAGVLVMVMNILFLFLNEDVLMVAHHLLLVLLLGYFTFALVRYLFVCRIVTQFTVYAALSSYLLLALIWALLYSTVDILEPGSFSAPLVLSAGGHLKDVGLTLSFPSFYYSIVTMTTLGYGDIYPLTGPGRTLASAQAVVGQMFIAITLARLITIFSSNRSSC